MFEIKDHQRQLITYTQFYVNLTVATNQNIIDTHTQREWNLNITLKIFIKLQEERPKEEEMNKKEIQNN